MHQGVISPACCSIVCLSPCVCSNFVPPVFTGAVVTQRPLRACHTPVVTITASSETVEFQNNGTAELKAGVTTWSDLLDWRIECLNTVPGLSAHTRLRAASVGFLCAAAKRSNAEMRCRKKMDGERVSEMTGRAPAVREWVGDGVCRNAVSTHRCVWCGVWGSNGD